MSNLMSYLFETNSFKICPENKPFWYTSGKIGPYFINAQFLYGNEKDANELLSFIDSELLNSKKADIPKNIFEKTFKQFTDNTIYYTVINEFKNLIEERINIDEIDYISGGERRDWYFSNIIAYLLKKPHITIYKDLTAVESSYDFSSSKPITDLSNKKVLHVADLLNTASSYERAWIPAIKALGGNICWSIVAVDRVQGGTENLKKYNITSLSLLNIDTNLFNKALELEIINTAQLNMLNEFTANPDETMKRFLNEHPTFIQDALKSDAKSAKRAQLCLDNKLYE